MKPTYVETNYGHMDLTQCPVHVKEDGSIVAMVPMKWIKSDQKQEVLAANGQTVSYSSYTVTEFKEVTLAPPGSAMQPSGGQSVT